MREATTQFRSDDRGVSEVAGAAILIAGAIAGALIVIGVGAIALDGVDRQVDRQNAQSVLQELDSRFDSLTSEGDSPQSTIDLGDTRLENFRVADAGYFEITVNENPGCSVNETLSGIRYDGKRGEAYLYQMGGVWALNDNDSTSITLPNFEYRNGAMDITINNITGRIDSTEVTITENISESRAESTQAQSALRQGDCVRPDNVTIQLQSPAYEGWATHLEEETSTSVEVFDDNRTVRLFLDQSKLPRKVNDSRNTVVNFSKPPYMRDVVLDASDGTISVDKGANNTYGVFAEPLTEDRLDIANISFLSEKTNSTRRPLDVVMVIDESGSMSNDDGDSTSRSEEAQTAAKSFVAELNESRDRVGVVSYDSAGSGPTEGGYYRLTDNGRYISDDFSSSGVNGSIDDIPDEPAGGTDLERGVYKANSIFSLKGTETRKKVMIALTDGVNNDCPDTNDTEAYDCDSPFNNKNTMDRINNSAAAGVTVYTIGFGGDDDVDEAFLEEAATQTGGKYYQAENADALDDVFAEIREDVNQQRFVVRRPLSTNFSAASGEIVTPQVAGGDDLATYNGSDGNFTNVNDPTAPSKFSHSFAVSDDESVNISLESYNCEKYEEIDKTYQNNSTTYSVVRCVDINESKAPTNYTPDTIYTDGDDASDLLNTNRAFWENDLNETLTQYPSVTLNVTNGTLSMESNQALVVFNLTYNNSRRADNKLAMLYQVGLAEEEANAEGVININVNQLKVGG